MSTFAWGQAGGAAAWAEAIEGGRASNTLANNAAEGDFRFMEPLQGGEGRDHGRDLWPRQDEGVSSGLRRDPGHGIAGVGRWSRADGRRPWRPDPGSAEPHP